MVEVSSTRGLVDRADEVRAEVDKLLHIAHHSQQGVLQSLEKIEARTSAAEERSLASSKVLKEALASIQESVEIASQHASEASEAYGKMQGLADSVGGLGKMVDRFNTLDLNYRQAAEGLHAAKLDVAQAYRDAYQSSLAAKDASTRIDKMVDAMGGIQEVFSTAKVQEAERAKDLAEIKAQRVLAEASAKKAEVSSVKANDLLQDVVHFLPTLEDPLGKVAGLSSRLEALEKTNSLTPVIADLVVKSPRIEGVIKGG